MTSSRESSRSRSSALLLLALAILWTVGACDDQSGEVFGPAGNVNGTWVLDDGAGPMYMRVMSTRIARYEPGDTCFNRVDYRIDAVDGTVFRVTELESGQQVTWELRRDGDALIVETGSERLTLDPADLDVGTLRVCEDDAEVEGDFPHPPCQEIEPVAIGGAVTGTLEDGDARWTDGTWYDLWSLQLSGSAAVTITMNAADPSTVDTYLMLYNDVATERLAQNDDIDYDGGNYNSRVTITLDAGCYIVVANSYSGDDAGEAGGDYTLSVATD